MPEASARGEGSEVRETKLPGLGIRYEFTTRRGSRLGIVHHRTGRRELLVYDPDDPDTCREIIALDSEDARTLSDLLAATRVDEQLDELRQNVEGLAIDWLRIEEDSPFDGRTIADSSARSRTGVSIVAILREGTSVPAPEPGYRMAAGDTLLVVGTPRGIEDLAILLRSG